VRRLIGLSAELFTPAVVLVAALGITACGWADYKSGRSPRAAHLDPSPAAHVAGAWFDPATADALSAELAAALDGTGWCAGWVVQIVDVSFEQADIGSNLGVGTAAHTCDNWAEITVEVVYTSESSEADDTAGIRVDAHDAPVASALQSHPSLLDGTGHRALLGYSGDDAVANAVAGLPAALAEVGEIAPVAAAPVEPGEPGGFTLPDAEGDGGNETWAQHQTEVLLGVGFLLVAGAVLPTMLVVTRRWSRVYVAPAPHPGSAAPHPVNPRRALRAALDRSQSVSSRS
jgi:hypothetical protein